MLVRKVAFFRPKAVADFTSIRIEALTLSVSIIAIIIIIIKAFTYTAASTERHFDEGELSLLLSCLCYIWGGGRGAK